MKTFLIRGVPHRIQQDGWWLSGFTPASPPPIRPEVRSGQDWVRLVLLAAVIGLGDVLVWQVMPGLSLVVFGVALIAAALIALPYPLTERQAGGILGFALLTFLPLVELVQPLSIAIALAGLSVVLVLLAGLRPGQVMRGAARLWPTGVAQTARDARGLIQPTDGDDAAQQCRAVLLGWLLPLGLGGLFIILLTLANPILLRWIEGVFQADLPQPGRVVFWLVLLPVVWTALSVSRMRDRLTLPKRRGLTAFGPAREGVLNQRSVARALILFNALFAVQTAMDVMFLYGGVELPEGITYAQYAHRGAYPLLATALLAGAFALLTRRWTDRDADLRLWLMVWVGQNVALVVSSLVRLDLYVGVYGLTHLRVWAAIWMVLVAVGLGLVIWQVWRGHGNQWLLLRSAGLGAATLYCCAFLSFDAIVARYNISHPVPLDTYHLCHLGDAAQPHVEAESITRARPLCGHGRHVVRAPMDWREWGFRNWRARRSLAALKAEARS